MKNKANYFGKAIFTAIFALLISAINSSAATFTVTNTNDSGTGSLRQAITDANAAGDDVINFDASFNVPRTITVASLMTITGSGALTINGPGMNLLTVSGNLATRVFEISGVNSPSIGTVTFNNLTVANGLSTDSGTGGGAGIGINNGAFDPPATFVPVVINNVFFNNNRGFVNPGGAIGGLRSCSLSVNNSVFTQNSANGGGAIHNGSGLGACNTVTITNSSFYENQIITTGVVPTISFGGNANGIYTISGCAFYNNGNGAGNNTVFLQSTATTGTITNTTFSGNRNIGAAIVLSLGAWTMTNVTVAKNTAESNNPPAGIQLANGAILNIGNSIVSGNTGPNGENNFLTNTTGLISQGYNIFGPSNEVTINGNTTGNLPGVNPLLDATIRNNGGATLTYNLRPGSPAIDAGNPTTFPATDQRGITRPQDGDGNGTSRSDIGAFEKRAIDILPPAFDFDGDRKADVSVFRPSNTLWYASKSSDSQVQTVQWGIATDRIVPADYNGDGKTDFAVFRDGFWYILLNGGGFQGAQWGSVGDIPFPADFDGDGKTDLAVFRNGTWFVLRSAGGTTTQNWGSAGDIPVVADYDADGKADFAVYRNGIWFVLNSNGGNTAIQWGIAGDKTVQADYNGDGKADYAVFRAGFWYVLINGGGFIGAQWGTTGDLASPADYDGDGRTDLAVFRAGTWFIQRTTAGVQVVNFGSAGDKPVANAFVP